MKPLIKHATVLHTILSDQQYKHVLNVSEFLQDISEIEFTHDLTRLTIKKIGVVFSLDPLFDAVLVFSRQYSFIEADVFLQEMGVLLFFAYKNILSNYCVSKVTIADIIKLSAQVAALPIDNVLDALEQCYQQFMKLMYEYGWRPGMSFSVWLQQYWWVPPVVLLSFGYSVVVRLLSGKGSESPEWGGMDSPDDAASAMPSLGDLFNQLDGGDDYN